MDIKSLNNSFIRSNDSDRIAREKTNSPSDGQAADRSGSAKDMLSLGATRYADEADFAKSVLQNLREQSIEQLRGIKSRIESGFYSSDAFAEKISEKMLTTVSDPVLTGNVSAENTQTLELTEELKDRLLNDEQVLNRISTRLLDELSNL